jgi:hypothetical protein
MGELCETDCECCTGRCDRPRPPDALGFAFPKRCLQQESKGMCLPRGALCADPGECCEAKCTQWSDGSFRCGVDAPPVSRDGGPPGAGAGTDAGPPQSGPEAGTAMPGVDAAGADAGGGMPPGPAPQCVPALGRCTQQADCCQGLTCAPVGGDLLCITLIP